MTRLLGAFLLPVLTDAVYNLFYNIYKGIQYDLFGGFLAGLSEMEERPVDFNEKLFHRLVDCATVYPDGRVVFIFRNGVEVGQSTNGQPPV